MCFSHLAAVFDPPLPFDGSLSPDVFSLLDPVSDPPLPSHWMAHLVLMCFLC